MTRTGISDSEMARHLGVSRQTIFRWKEGLTARPRVREDVLRCAERLRLTPAERDALLLAAGFAPEQPLVPGKDDGRTMNDQRAPDDQALKTQDERSGARDISETAPTLSTAAPKRARWILLAIVLFALGAGGAFILLPGESSNLVALLQSPTPTPIPLTSTPSPTPLPPEQVVLIAQLNSRGGQAPPYNVTARLRLTLEREIENQNLAGARLIDIADQVREPTMAERLRVRSGAETMLWGNYSGDNARVEIASAPRVPVVHFAASVFPILPRDQTVTLDLSTPNQLRTLALLTLIPLHLERGDVSNAQHALHDAENLTPYSNEMRAAVDFYRGYLMQTTAPRDLNGAIAAYNRNLNSTSLYESFLNRGLAFLVQNESTPAKADWQRATSIEDARPEAWRATCWAYALEQQPQLALPLCDAAVTRDATAWSLDTRGIVYAELGRYEDAANEFSNFVRWLDMQPARTREIFSPSRRAWIETLRAGKNPFDAELLNQLRGAP